MVDAWYDAYLGVVVLVRVIDGTLRSGQRVKMMQQGSTHLIDRIGVFNPKRTEVESLGPGEIGFITAQIKEVAQAAVGDTITDEKRPAAEAVKGAGDSNRPFLAMDVQASRGNGWSRSVRAYVSRASGAVPCRSPRRLPAARTGGQRSAAGRNTPATRPATNSAPARRVCTKARDAYQRGQTG